MKVETIELKMEGKMQSYLFYLQNVYQMHPLLSIYNYY